MRIPYSSKWKRNAHTLLPYLESSPAIKDHLVQVHDPKYNGFPGVTLEDLDADVPTNLTVSDKMHVSIKHIASAFTPNECNGPSMVDPRVIESVKHHILTDPRIQDYFTSPIVTHHQFISPTVHAFYTDNMRCPYAVVDMKVAINDLTQLLDCINSSRADDRGDWLTIGFALHDISSANELLDLWIVFSQRCPSKFNVRP